MSQANLSFLKTHTTPHFRQWLANLAESREALGSELAETCTDTLNTQPADYDTMLRRCEELGWIARSFFAPSISQQAFGGLTYSGSIHNTSDDAKRVHTTWFAWRAVDVEAIKSFCGQTKPDKTNYAIGDVVRYAPLFVAQICGGTAMRKARGRVVGFSTLRLDDGTSYPRVAWDDNPKDEPACQAPVDEPPRCVTNSCKGCEKPWCVCPRAKVCACPRVPYAARPVHPKAIRHA